MRNRRVFVLTKSGHKGIVRINNSLFEGKVKVYLINSDLSPKLDAKGEQLKMLCDPATLEQIGFID